MPERLRRALTELLELWLALLADIIEWANSVMPDSERRR